MIALKFEAHFAFDKAGADFLRVNYFAQPKLLLEDFAHTKWHKTPKKTLKKHPKDVKVSKNFKFCVQKLKSCAISEICTQSLSGTF